MRTVCGGRGRWNLDVLGHGDTFAEALQCLRDGLQIYFEHAYVKDMEDSLPREPKQSIGSCFTMPASPAS